jgi:lipopolysaccharide export system permease protein
LLLDFFPSRRLTLYLAKMFAMRIVAVLAMLVLVLMMLDLLSRTGDILAYAGNGQAELLQYASLRGPQLVKRFLPYSVLLATIITLATLNQNSEVVAMKAAGLSAHQILAPLLLTAVVVAGISFVFNERIVTRATATLKAWEDVEYGPIPVDPSTRTNVYFNDGNDVLMARELSGNGTATVLTGVTFYERDDAGMIARQITGPRAVWAGSEGAGDGKGGGLAGWSRMRRSSLCPQPRRSVRQGRCWSRRGHRWSRWRCAGSMPIPRRWASWPIRSPH